MNTQMIFLNEKKKSKVGEVNTQLSSLETNTGYWKPKPKRERLAHMKFMGFMNGGELNS